MAVSVLWLFLTLPWAGLQYVIVVFPDNTHLLVDVAALVIVLRGCRCPF